MVNKTILETIDSGNISKLHAKVPVWSVKISDEIHRISVYNFIAESFCS